jgi:hypothetical protein
MPEKKSQEMLRKKDVIMYSKTGGRFFRSGTLLQYKFRTQGRAWY